MTLAAQRRRVNKLRAMKPLRTCPSSRHLHMLAEELARGNVPHVIVEDPRHVAASILAVLESLWALRAKK